MPKFKHKFKAGQFVLLKVKEQQIQMKVLGTVKDGPFYFLDWEGAGFSSLLNSVKVIERALNVIEA